MLRRNGNGIAEAEREGVVGTRQPVAALGLVETDVREGVPESSLLGSDLATGWYLLWFDEPSPAALKPEVLRSISTGSELFACQIEEHAMCSTAAYWVDGAERWFVAHDSEDGLTNLEVLGSPPDRTRRA